MSLYVDAVAECSNELEYIMEQHIVVKGSKKRTWL